MTLFVCEVILWVIILLSAIFFMISFLTYTYFKWQYIFWKKRNIPFIQPKFPYGSIQHVHGEEHFCLFMQKYYIEFKDRAKYFGLFFYSRPVAVITDWALIESILKTDSSFFNDRSLYHNVRDDPLSGNLVLLAGQEAKRVRKFVSPAFSPMKMKDMFSTICQVSERLNNYCLRETLNENNELDIGDLLENYMIDCIGASAFGIECNSLKDPDNDFRKMCKIGLSKPRLSSKMQFFLNYNQDWGRFFHTKLIRDDVSKYFLGIVQETINNREQNNVQRKDFLDVLIERKREIGEDKLTMNELAAQAYAFFTPGFDTMSTAMIFMLYEMAKNPSIQQKARCEIRNVLNEHNGDLTYDTISKMSYVDQIISETLRCYPPFSMLRRIAVNDYKVPGTDQIIHKGTPIIIPVYAIHHDPKYFPNPDEFKPERFATEEAKKRTLAFGLGLRNCIGQRFSKMQLSIALITFIKNFEILPSDQTASPLEFEPLGLRLTPNGKVYLKLNNL